MCPSGVGHDGKKGTVHARRRVHSQGVVVVRFWLECEGNTPELAYSEYRKSSKIYDRKVITRYTS